MQKMYSSVRAAEQAENISHISLEEEAANLLALFSRIDRGRSKDLKSILVSKRFHKVVHSGSEFPNLTTVVTIFFIDNSGNDFRNMRDLRTVVELSSISNHHE